MENLVIVPAAAAALAYFILVSHPPGLLRSALKTAAVLLLALGAVWSGGPWMLVLALLFCAIGDWFLSRPGERAFVAGVGAFALGHLGYIALFLGHQQAALGRLLEPAGMLAALLLILLGVAAAVVLAPRAGLLRLPVLCYIPVIISMGIAVLTLPPGIAAASALAFIASDLILAAGKFLLPGAGWAAWLSAYAVWGLYWAAQAGFFTAFA